MTRTTTMRQFANHHLRSILYTIITALLLACGASPRLTNSCRQLAGRCSVRRIASGRHMKRANTPTSATSRPPPTAFLLVANQFRYRRDAYTEENKSRSYMRFQLQSRQPG
eukprot:GHVU01137636.1.p1 GENE.GHVU01137636.1~~GHVU01137636.1.p1  ORF type:complete len:111 (-),score=7.38 GHVU01137636.1:260-592(-)